MLPNLPKNATLEKKIGIKEVRSSLHFLSNHRGELAPYRTVEDMVFDLDGPIRQCSMQSRFIYER
jgi:hypothetical protein